MRSELRSGFTLLELIVAITLLGTVGTALVALVRQTRATMDQALASEMRVRHASRTLHELSRETRAQLERRIGRRRSDAYEVRVDRESHDLFALALVDTATGVVLVETIVHRPRRGVDGR